MRGPKDPNAPKRPKSPYQYFVEEQQAVFKNANPTRKVPTHRSRIWTGMGEAAKAVYVKLADDDKARFKQEKEAYQKTDAWAAFQAKVRHTHIRNAQAACATAYWFALPLLGTVCAAQRHSQGAAHKAPSGGVLRTSSNTPFSLACLPGGPLMPWLVLLACLCSAGSSAGS